MTDPADTLHPGETEFRALFRSFTKGETAPEVFIKAFMERWRFHRDAQTQFDPRFQRLIDRVFTSCDCYAAIPEDSWEIDAEALRQEVQLLAYLWFG